METALDVSLVLVPEALELLLLGVKDEAKPLPHGTDLQLDIHRVPWVRHFVRHRRGPVAGWPGAVLASACSCGSRGVEPGRRDQGQWTVVMRRLAARSRAKRPSCQGVR